MVLEAVSTLALTEGVKFLYAQGAELIKWWLARKAEPGKAAAPPKLPELPKKAFVEQPADASVDERVLGEVVEELRRLRADLGEVGEGIVPVEKANEGLVARIDALRGLVEAVYGRRMRFEGEPAPAEGEPTNIKGTVEVEKLLGYAAGARAIDMRGGTIEGFVKAKEIAAGGVAVGVEFKGRR